jgi:purine-binding chemotaxis protein CheW
MAIGTHTPENATQQAAAGKYLTFRLGLESYGIKVLYVREIIRLVNITMVPRMPPYVKGVINLRGRIIPVMDLRLKLGLAEADQTDESCIVVVQVSAGPQQAKQMGVIVDAVEEVINIAASDIEETPDFGTRVDTTYVLGMAKIKGVVKALLDIDQVIGGESTAANPTSESALT